MHIEPLVTIIVPAFNAQDFIENTLDSVLAQNYGNLEIIVVDDGSTDRTAFAVRRYGSRVRYLSQPNSGGCAVPRNTGIKHSSGEFLCFMDADDLMVPDRIATQVAFLNRHPHVGLVFCDYRNFDEDGPFEHSHFQTCPRLWPRLRDQDELILKDSRSLLAEENCGIAGSLLIRRKVAEIEGGFEPTLKSCEDFHFYFRAARHTDIGLINKVGMMRRVHRGNMSSNLTRMKMEGIRSRSMLCESEPDPKVRMNLRRYIANCLTDLARYHADQRRFLESLSYDWQVISRAFLWAEKLKASKNVLRTIAVAAGMHRPESSNSSVRASTK